MTKIMDGKKVALDTEESLIDRVNHANDQDYFEGGGREIEEFHNTLTETMKEVVSAIRSINPDAAFTIPSPKILFESFYESERNKKVLAKHGRIATTDIIIAT